jgi:MFS family permease
MHKKIYLIILFFLIQGVIHNLGHPVTPAFVRAQGIPDFMFGVFFASMSFGLMLGGPLWGVLSDYGHKRFYIVLGLLIYSLGQIAFGYIGNQTLMVLFRFLSGFGVVSSMTLMTSHIIENASVSHRAKFLAYAGAAFTLGASLGYGIGGFIATNPLMIEWFKTNDFRRLFLIQGVTNTLYAMIVFLTIGKDEEIDKEQTQSFSTGLKSLFKIEPTLLIFFISLTLITIGTINLSKYIDVHFDTLGYNPQQLGNFVMATGFVSLFASLWLVPKVAKFKRQIMLMMVLQVVSALIVIYVFRATAFLLVIYTVYMLYVIIKTIYQPLEQNYIANYGKTGSYGGLMGLRQSFVSIGMVIGPLIGGFIYEYRPLLLFDFSALSFLVGTLLLGFVYFLNKKKVKDILINKTR